MIKSPRTIVILTAAFLVVGIFTWRWLLTVNQIMPGHSLSVRDHQGKLLRAYLSDDEKWRISTNLTRLPNGFQEALLCLEDRRFFSHWGVDPLAVLRATYQNLKSGKVVSGASTLSMQLARLLRPKSRNFLAKLLDTIDAVALESIYTKQQILTKYLDLTPYGSNAEGVEAASQLYFDTKFSNLTLGQYTFLLLLPQNPSRFRAWSPKQWRQGLERNLDRLITCGVINAEDKDLALQTKIPKTWQRFPSHAPHFSDWLKQKHPTATKLTTTIDLPTQMLTASYVEKYRPRWQNAGIHNVSVIVLDVPTRRLKAIVGNMDYFSQQHGQKIPTFFVPRSPGSTLKPLLYSYALDQALFLPETQLEDAPIEIAGYAPENFSGTYRGLVRAREALSQSLNLPFVGILQQVRVDPFLAFLERAGLTEHTPSSELGLSLILGGIEVTPWALTQTYLTLANSGSGGPIIFQPNKQVPAVQAISPGASLLTQKTLQVRDRPDYPERHRFARDPRGISWKTGTSQGRKDAWSIGFKDTHLVAVWVGNLAQTGSPELVGSKAAAPIMFDLIEAMPKVPSADSSHPDWLTDVEVCRYSGYRPNSSCPHKEMVAGVKGSIPSQPCPFHQSLLIDKSTGRRVFRSCAKKMNVEERVFNIPPPRIRRMLNYDMGDLNSLPPVHPNCHQRSPSELGSLVITSPKDNFTYLALSSMGQTQLKLPLKVKSAANASDVACFIDGQKISSKEAGSFAPLVEVESGKHNLICYDIDGQTAAAHFTVEEI